MKEIYKGEQLYIIGCTSLKRLGIRFIPYEVTLNSMPNNQDVFVVGRNIPDTDVSSGQDFIQMSLDFIAEVDSMEDVRDKCNWLRSLRYTTGPNEPQEKVKLVWGGLYNKEVWTVRNVVIKYSHFMRNFNLLPKRAEVEITFGFAGLGNGIKRSRNIYQDDIQNLGSSTNYEIK